MAEDKKPGNMYRAVYGLMVDMETEQVFDGLPVEVKKVSGWMQMQLDAGKLEKV